MIETTPRRPAYRKRPVTVEAVRWTGDNLDEIYEFTGCDNFGVLDEQDRANCDDPEASATVFDKLHSTWVLVYDGQWIIKGIKGEFYPCAGDVFAATYEPVPGEDDPVPRLLALELPENDSGASTVRGYLAALLAVLWGSGDVVHPFGNSGWQHDLYEPMTRAGVARIAYDKDGYATESCDSESYAEADRLILAAIEAMGRPA